MNTRELNTEWEKKVFNKNVGIVEDYAIRTTTAEDKKEIEEDLAEAITIWIEEYTNTRVYEEEDYVFSENILLNKEKNKARLLIVAIRKRDGN